MIAARVRDHRGQCRRVHHQRAVRRDDRRQAGREAAEPALEGIAPGGVDQRDLDARATGIELAEHGLQAETVAADVGFGPDLRVDRQHVALARRLDAETAEEDQRHRARLDLAIELVERAAHAVAGQVLADFNGKAVALELVGDVARVVERFLQRGVRVWIFGVANDQRITVAGGQGWRNRDERNEQGQKKKEANFHNQRGPAKKAPLPACAAATLTYAMCIIKPRKGGVNRLEIRHYRDN
ncbi:hypothetical protein ACVWZR_003351 [Bradyrhizobium sp. i1.3.1]